MNKASEVPAAPRDDVSGRQDWVHGRADTQRWRRGFIGPSGRARRRGRARGPVRGDAWLERRWSSRVLHRVGEATAHAGAGLVVTVAVLAWVIVGWASSFPSWWEVALYSTSSSITLIMVFAIQHTQARQQAAMQRKLDEVLRAIAGASDSLIAVEEAPDEELGALADLNLKDRERSAS